MTLYKCELEINEILLSIKVDAPYREKYSIAITGTGTSYLKVGDYKTLDEAIKRINLFLEREEVKQCT